ncbi:host attachment protein [Paraburkholderia tropica]|uniref:host attachment protein n=1 Tax=Paraburkholderia tropica TaxID=92647 RepID=UPI002AB160E0|nr:host attachment protein [Paraburkholderia tropica]
MNRSICIVVANRATARIFEADGPSRELVERHTLVHPASRLKESDLVLDTPGRTHDRFGHGSHRTDPDSSQREHEMISFASEIVKELSDGVTGGTVSSLILVAPAAFLGVLRNRLKATTLERVVLELNKDICISTRVLFGRVFWSFCHVGRGARG